MTENAVEKQIISFLQRKGWRAQRNHVGLFFPAAAVKKMLHLGRLVYTLGITISYEGFPDWTFLRRVQDGPYGRIDLIHVEAKRPGQKPKPKQHEIMASLNHLGELSVWADSLESFERLYSQYFPAG